MPIEPLHRIDNERDFFSVFPLEQTAPDTDVDLWNAIRGGDQNALAIAFDKYSKPMYVYGLRLAGNNDAMVEDAIQEIFVRIWSRRDSLGQTTSIKFYLLKCLRHELLRALNVELRKSTDKEAYAKASQNVDFSYEFALIENEQDTEIRERLTRAQQGLTKRQKEAIYLKFYEQLKYEDIASVMELSTNSAYTLVGQALRKLRDFYR
jgi:RNA polymerase sigma factor (sigma-70 family)